LDVFAAAEGAVVELAEQGDPQDQPRRRARPSTAQQRHRANSQGETVLIVDDEPDLVQLLKATLAPEGYRLLSAYDGATALRLARAERPSLILLDWGMPGIDGLEVCRSLRADADPDLRRMPVVLITGQVGQEKIAIGFAAGVTDYLTKPFSPSHVRSRVRGWLLRSRPNAADTAPAAEGLHAPSPGERGLG
jgi:DNA-binding response OmpR family regulator